MGREFETYAIEPLAKAIRCTPITGNSDGNKSHKISSYADDVLLFLTNPEASVPAVLDLISCFINSRTIKYIFPSLKLLLYVVFIICSLLYLAHLGVHCRTLHTW